MNKIVSVCFWLALCGHLSFNNVYAGGLTIVTHGWYAESLGWVVPMGDAIAVRASDRGSVARASMDIIHDANGVPIDILANYGSPSYGLAGSGEMVVTLSWRHDSTNRHTALTASVIANELISDGYIIQQPIHLIGHSRGGWLVGEIARVLAEKNIWVDQVTFLDPALITLGEDWQWNFRDPQAMAYDNIVFADEYLQWVDQWWGFPLDWTHMIGLGEVLSDANYNGNAHSAVHDWYHGTIDINAQSVNGHPIGPRSLWYNFDPTPYGYMLSRIANGVGLRLSAVNGLSIYHGGISDRIDVAATRLWPLLGCIIG